MNYLKAKKAHLSNFGRIVIGVKPFHQGPLFRLVTGRSWCGPWRGIGCHAEVSAIESEIISERWKKKKKPRQESIEDGFAPCTPNWQGMFELAEQPLPTIP